MGDKLIEEAERTGQGKAKLAVLPRSLQLLGGLIFVVAFSSIGSVHLMPSTGHGSVKHRDHPQIKGFVYSSARRTNSQTAANNKSDKTRGQQPTQHSSSPDESTSSSTRTLALVYPPGLMGGYRNQVIRFIGLCMYAKQNNMTQLLEPSILWSTQLQGIGTSVQWLPIPMDWLFDVDYWNQVASAEGLPRLVHEVPNSDCWQSGLFDGYNTSDWGPLARASLLESKSFVGVTNETVRMISNDPTFKARRTDVLPAVSHCTKPFVYGSGKMGGRLWNDVMKWREKKSTSSSLPHDVDRAVLRALQPAPRWQEVAQSCLARNGNDNNMLSYVALHARIELEMFAHPCGKTMERNLTNIFRQVQHLVEEKEPPLPHNNITGLFVAVSRTGMEYTSDYNAGLREIAEHNVRVFDHFVGHADVKLGEHLNIFECGERLLQDYYRDNPHVPDHGSLLQAVVNFHLAVNAAIFVGVRGSSYSTDVWTTRFYLGKGQENYRYTKDGAVEPIENGGLPDPHVNCGTLNRKAAHNGPGRLMMNKG